jgi:hypothetical protein
VCDGGAFAAFAVVLLAVLASCNKVDVRCCCCAEVEADCIDALHVDDDAEADRTDVCGCAFAVLGAVLAECGEVDVRCCCCAADTFADVEADGADAVRCCVEAPGLR